MSVHINFLHADAADPLHAQMQQMYVQDFGDSPDALRPTLSIEDKHAVMLMTNSLKFVGNRYEVGLPWRSDDAVLQ